MNGYMLFDQIQWSNGWKKSVFHTELVCKRSVFYERKQLYVKVLFSRKSAHFKSGSTVKGLEQGNENIRQ